MNLMLSRAQIQIVEGYFSAGVRPIIVVAESGAIDGSNNPTVILGGNGTTLIVLASSSVSLFGPKARFFAPARHGARQPRAGAVEGWPVLQPLGTFRRFQAMP